MMIEDWLQLRDKIIHATIFLYSKCFWGKKIGLTTWRGCMWIAKTCILIISYGTLLLSHMYPFIILLFIWIFLFRFHIGSKYKISIFFIRMYKKSDFVNISMWKLRKRLSVTYTLHIFFFYTLKWKFYTLICKFLTFICKFFICIYKFYTLICGT